jgi:Mg-chelatase subunit ChlD
VPRDDDLNEGISNPPVPGIWTPGRPRWWRDAGPDWAPGSGDDLDWQAFLDRLAAEGVTLLAAVSGAAPVELGGSRADLSAYWQAWAARTPGGSAQELDTVAALPERLAEQVAGVGRQVRRLSPAARPAPQAAWVVFDPPGIDDLTVPATGRRLDFSVTLSPPPDTPPGDYPILLTLHADGGLVAQRSVRLRWTAPCPGTATPTVEATSVVEATPTARISATPMQSATLTATLTATPEPPSATPLPLASPTPSATGTPSSTTTPTHTPIVDAGPGRLWLPVAYRRYCDPKARPRVDVALVLDTSSSMAGAKLAAARDAAVGFLGLLALPRDHAAVLTFDEQARLRQWLTGERPLLELALLGLRSAPGTRIDLGIEGARRELLGPRGRTTGAGGDDGRAVAAIVLLTDGRPDAGGEADTLAAAARARQAGIELFTIGLGAGADAALLERLAGDPARHYRAGGAEELAAIYGRIAGDIGCR